MDAEAQRHEAIEGVRAAHRGLLDDLARLTDEQARSASLLPKWSVGHVLTHIARNADSHTRMLSAAIRGEAVTQYDGGHERRAADIAAGADRSAAELVADFARSVSELEATYDAMTAESWAGHGLNANGEIWPCEAMPFHRWREVAIHRADLGLGYTPADWPDAYVKRELAISLRLLPERLGAADQVHLLAWLLGRRDQPSVDLSPWQFHADHYMR